MIENREKERSPVITAVICPLCVTGWIYSYSYIFYGSAVIFSVSHLFFRRHSSSLRLCSEENKRQRQTERKNERYRGIERRRRESHIEC